MTMDERNSGYAAQIEHFIRRRLVDGYAERATALWKRDSSSEDAYLRSVEPRREEWRALLAPPELAVAGEVEVSDWCVPGGRWIVVPLDDGLTAEGALVVPTGATQLVVFQHGLGSTPERVFGVGDDAEVYDRIGARLVEAGYAVLAPMNLIKVPVRNRAQSLCRLAGTTMEGLEYARFQSLLNAALDLAPELPESVIFAGLSWGGCAAQYWAPLEPRIKAVATLGFFNDRPRKMVVEDTRWSSFYATDGHHAFLQGLLQGFSDADLASLVCPRPFMVQHGRADVIGWWPLVVDELERARAHWDALGIGDRVELQLHRGGHVVDGPALVKWVGRCA